MSTQPQAGLLRLDTLPAVLRGGVPQARIARVLDELRALLAPLHAEGRAHGAVAPNSIGLDAQGGAHLLAPASAAAEPMRPDAATPFQALEQFSDDPELRPGPWTDAYALAAVAALMVSGEAPPAVPSRCVNDTWSPLAGRVKGYEPAFLAALDRNLALPPQARDPQALAGWGITAASAPVAAATAAVAAAAGGAAVAAAPAGTAPAGVASAAMPPAAAPAATPVAAPPRPQELVRPAHTHDSEMAEEPAPVRKTADAVEPVARATASAEAESGAALAAAATAAPAADRPPAAPAARSRRTHAPWLMMAMVGAALAFGVVLWLRGGDTALLPDRVARTGGDSGERDAMPPEPPPLSAANNVPSRAPTAGGDASPGAAPRPDARPQASPDPTTPAGAGNGATPGAATDPAAGNPSAATPPAAGAATPSNAAGAPPPDPVAGSPAAGSPATPPAAGGAAVSGTPAPDAPPTQPPAAGTAAPGGADPASAGPSTTSPSTTSPASAAPQPADGTLAATPADTPAPAAPDALAGGNCTAPLRLNIQPWGEVLVDGTARGVSPPLRSLCLRPGRYVITVRNGNLPPATQTVQIRNGQGASVSHTFQ
ncbi:hypothetical protein CEG14_09480 [Bordetella genomosp. 1]|uniref:Protein kinase domain-containing protein n=1 Tax=Bordetella genomosp. 1 TaxID=1395607 RepID=A0A261SED3_9BORD|nr:hypothetical protein [Bordetella genomosp. 1]OZI35322.1 hypothetical protein CEG14_09480 [Bordetella genomosp. 1]